MELENIGSHINMHTHSDNGHSSTHQ